MSAFDIEEDGVVVAEDFNLEYLPGVGDILEIKFLRPRNRAALLEDSEYYRCRERLITFLEERAHKKPVSPANPPSPANFHWLPFDQSLTQINHNPTKAP